jgi:hypothetical protein
MPEIPRAILLPSPSQLSQRSHARAIQGDSDSAIEAARARRQSQGAADGTGPAFLTLIDSRRDDTVETRGKQFRFRPYSSRGTADGAAREAELAGRANETEAIGAQSEDDISADVLDGFGAGARERNSSAFIASFIAQEHLRQGLYNPQFEAASDAYRRAGGSPSAIDNQPRVLSFAV